MATISPMSWTTKRQLTGGSQIYPDIYERFTVTIKEITQDLINNTSRIKINLKGDWTDTGYYLFGYGVYYSTDGGETFNTVEENYTSNQSKPIAKRSAYAASSGWKDIDLGIIPHNQDGTLNLIIRVKQLFAYSYTSIRWSRNNTAYGDSAWTDQVMTVSTIPRASELTFENNSISYNYLQHESSSTYTAIYLKKNISTYYDELETKLDNTVINNYPINSGETEYNLSQYDMLNLFRSSMYVRLLNDDNGYYYNLKLTVKTYTDNTKETFIGSNEYNLKLYITNMQPSLGRSGTGSTVIFENDLSSISGDNIVSNYSNITSGYYFKVASNCILSELTIAGENVMSESEILSQDDYFKYYYVEHTFENSNITDYSLHILDSHGLSYTYENIKDIINYFNISFDETNIKRNVPVVNNELRIKFSGRFWNDNFGISDNELHIEYKTTDLNNNIIEDWTSLDDELTIDENIYECDYITDDLYNYNTLYKIYINVSDLVGTYVLNGRTITKGAPVFYWTENDFYVGTSGGNAKIYLNGNEFTGATVNNQHSESTTETYSCDYINNHGGSGSIDTAMSDTSENAVQNKVIKAYADALGTIQDIGSNSNGQYIKYSNGLMICTKSINATASFVSGTYFGSGNSHACLRTGSLGNWAVTFTEIWGAWFSSNQNIGSSYAMWEPSVYNGWSTSACGNISGARINSTTNSQSTNFRLLAIGKWK